MMDKITRAIDDYLDQILIVTITDGRIFEGTLNCIDRDLNLVLRDTFEYYHHPTSISNNHTSDKFKNNKSKETISVSSQKTSSNTHNDHHHHHDEPEVRMVGMITIPGRHIFDIQKYQGLKQEEEFL